MSNVENDKIMGFVPKDKYVLIVYYLLLAAAGIGVVSMLFSMVGIILPLGALANVAGLCALVLGLVGYFGFKDDFSGLDQSHLLYLCVLFGIFFVLGILLGSALYMAPVLMYLVMVPLALAQLLLYVTGFNSYKHSRTVTKDNVKEEVKLALRRA